MAAPLTHRVHGHLPGGPALSVHQPVVQPPPGHQLLVGTRLYYTASLQAQDARRVLDRRQAVGDDQCGTTLTGLMGGMK